MGACKTRVSEQGTSQQKYLQDSVAVLLPSATDFPDKQNLALHTPSAVQCQQNKCSLIKTDKSTSEPSFHLARANRETAISNAGTISVQYYS